VVVVVVVVDVVVDVVVAIVVVLGGYFAVHANKSIQS